MGPKQAPASALMSLPLPLPPPRPLPPLRPFGPSCHEAGRTWRPFVNLREEQGFKAGEKPGEKGDREVAVNEGQTVPRCICSRVHNSRATKPDGSAGFAA